MPTNVWFNNYQNSGEQDLVQSLIVEMVKIYGMDLYYVPRQLNNFDELYGSDDISSFTKTALVEMYLENPSEGFSAEGTFFAKFGTEIRDRLTFCIAIRTFDKEVGVELSMTRPNEGDLVYYPPDKKLFEIKFVDKKSLKYPLGILPVYRLECELYEYSNEQFETGIPELDELFDGYSTNIINYALGAQDGHYLTDEFGNVLVTQDYVLRDIENADNKTINDYANDLLDFSEENPFGDAST